MLPAPLVPRYFQEVINTASEIQGLWLALISSASHTLNTPTDIKLLRSIDSGSSTGNGCFVWGITFLTLMCMCGACVSPPRPLFRPLLGCGDANVHSGASVGRA